MAPPNDDDQASEVNGEFLCNQEIQGDREVGNQE
jgi:hypothetical protein